MAGIINGLGIVIVMYAMVLLAVGCKEDKREPEFSSVSLEPIGYGAYQEVYQEKSRDSVRGRVDAWGD